MSEQDDENIRARIPTSYNNNNNNNNNNNQFTSSKSKEVIIIPASSLMDLDLDLDNSWPLDQVSFTSFNNNNPFSSFVVSSSEQPCSPLWAFSDSDNNNNNNNNFKFFNCNNNSNTFTESSTAENEDCRKFPSPLLGFMPTDNNNADHFCVLKERMTQALRNFKESTEQHVLAQIWAPVKFGGRYVLTTSGQPFVLDPCSNGLNQYRMVSLLYSFSVDGESDGQLGLPGRVFCHKMPEWTPNVQFYSDKEFSRRDHAQKNNVQGTLALPVFEPTGISCVGVIELIMTSPKINYAPEVDKVCKALQAVNLRSSEILDHQNTQICNEGRQNALAEILEILNVVCETHKLPLAQTWVPCKHRSVLTYGGGLKKSCSSFDGSCMGKVCMSTTDLALYVVDAHVWGFREACVEHHLQKGQGVAGRAFLSHNSCFCSDITKFCKTDYPLVHYARMFGLTGCFAICLRSSHTGEDDYILEIFLPPSISDKHEQETLLGSLLATMKEHFKSLSVASGMELENDEGSVEIIEAFDNGKLDSRRKFIQIPQIPKKSPCGMNGFPSAVELPRGINGFPSAVEIMPQNSSIQQMLVRLDSINDGINTVNNTENNIHVPVSENKETKKRSERKRGKAEKSISLDVLQQYFAGSLKDAAKSLGVCPTTMKRICRQHGISRWPSRKINKVNRSLSKLKHVIESVQGAEGAFGLPPLTTSPLPVAVRAISWLSNANGSDHHNSPSNKQCEPQTVKIDSPASNVDVGFENQLISSRENFNNTQNGFSPDLDKLSNRSKTASGSREESAGSPTSLGSCQGSPAVESKLVKNLSFSPINEPFVRLENSPEPNRQPILSRSISAMLIEDAGSSKDLRNLCPTVADAIIEERIPEFSWTNQPLFNQIPNQAQQQPMATLDETERGEIKSITIKATYKDDIIRFRISPSTGIMVLKDEVAKRLKLEIGTFDIKYLDDDQEWVLIACDADLQECLDISRSSGSNLIRLLINDILPLLGSSCESTVLKLLCSLLSSLGWSSRLGLSGSIGADHTVPFAVWFLGSVLLNHVTYFDELN
ncbi:hypothetical protein ACFE04_007521 [Oxalis oulophora]